MFAKTLEQNLKNELAKLGFTDVEVNLTPTDNPKFGDFTTNVALQLSKLPAKKAYQSPPEIAKELAQNLQLPILSEVQIAGPGFLNFYLKDQALVDSLDQEIDLPQAKTPKKYLVEYAQPNTHKAFHIGHLRNIILGESLARLLETQGHQAFRGTYDGDIGPHVAKAIWGLLQRLEEYQAIKQTSLTERAAFLGQIYALGAQAYETDPAKKSEIDQINQRLYQRDFELLPLWQETKQWSLDAFEELYKYLGTHFDRVFLESEVEARGKQIVEENIGAVFVEDQGAVIFPGEDYGLHNRVFITSKDTPTYEAKELGLTELEYEVFPFDQSLHVVANEQAGYFSVVSQALVAIDPKWEGKKRHISYGMVNLKSGKMSSRTGEVITAQSLIDQVKNQLTEVMKESKLETKEQILNQVTVGSIKFSMLKYSASTNIAFDINESVSLHGDSGPYLQYTYARTQSLLRNSKQVTGDRLQQGPELEAEERNLLRLMLYFPMAVEEATQSLNPTPVCTYLLTLAKAFNLFYQKYPILKSSQAKFRLSLTKKVGQILAKGLFLLGIEAPERM